MTLVPFPPEALDELALRLLDVAAEVRQMAHISRENEIEGFRLHGNKVHEWMNHIEHWVVDANARIEAEVKRRQGVRRANRLLAATVAKPADRALSRRKKVRSG